MKLKIFNLKNTNSTNDFAIKKIKQGLNNGIVVTDRQTKGRGRYGNKWVSLKDNLFVSIFYKTNKKLNFKKITRLNCLKIKRVLSKFVKVKIRIKPPNDLFIQKKKICGILQETINFKGSTFIIIGIGINIRQSPDIKNYPTTHLSIYNDKINKMIIFKNIKKCYEDELICI
tara:strand:- start:678 stop:1193 length:516 start_codon:yes stop_codon:yes gene_type:complete